MAFATPMKRASIVAVYAGWENPPTNAPLRSNAYSRAIANLEFVRKGHAKRLRAPILPKIKARKASTAADRVRPARLRLETSRERMMRPPYPFTDLPVASRLRRVAYA